MAEWMQAYLDAWNSHDGSKVVTFTADDAVYEDLALGQVHRGRDAIAMFVQTSDEFSRDYHLLSVSEQASGLYYALEWEMAGTNTGPAGALPATHKPYRIRGVSVGVVDEDGKIKRNRDYWNLADYLMQVGILPRPT